MKIRTLNECLSCVIDKRGVTPKKLNSDWCQTGYRVLSANNVKTTGLQNEDDIRCINEETYKKWMKEEVKKGDIILTSEAPAGEVLYWDSDEKIVAGQRLYILRTTEEVDSLYLKYYLQSEKGQLEIKNKCSGSTVFGISNKTFDDIEIVLPDTKEEQIKIGKLLYSIDKKINNNKKITKLIQDYLKLVNNYWFLQFEYPDESNRPYKINGGKMKWNSELNMEIPIDWECIQLKELIKRNSTSFNYKNNVPTIDLSVMPTSNISLDVLNNSCNFQTNLFEMKKGDILFGSIRPYLKKMGIAPCNGAYAGTVISYTPNNETDYNVIISTMFRDDFFEFAVNNSKGTKMPVVSSDDLLEYKFPYNNSVSKKFNNIINAKEIICETSIETQKLQILRDFLLPFLISGQISLEE